MRYWKNTGTTVESGKVPDGGAEDLPNDSGQIESGQESRQRAKMDGHRAETGKGGQGMAPRTSQLQDHEVRPRLLGLGRESVRSIWSRVGSHGQSSGL